MFKFETKFFRTCHFLTGKCKNESLCAEVKENQREMYENSQAVVMIWHTTVLRGINCQNQGFADKEVLAYVLENGCSRKHLSQHLSFVPPNWFSLTIVYSCFRPCLQHEQNSLQKKKKKKKGKVNKGERKGRKEIVTG